MEIRLLGALQLARADALVPLPRRQQRALLAVLALRAGEIVSTDRLIEDLWGADAPRSALGSLQNAVSSLRKAVGPDALLTEPPGYRLAIERAAVDALRFERLVEEARTAPPRERGPLLADALALWRGPALADLAFEPFAAMEIARLEELRLTAVEERLAVDLELGLHAALVPELEVLVTSNPLRERLRGQLMLALYRSGRQAEALAVYRATRLALADELGLAPSRELQELEQAILRQDASLSGSEIGRKSDPTRPRLTPLVSAGTTVVGRNRELEELELLLERAAGGQSGSLLVRGDPGMGKSTILDCAADLSRAALVLRTCGVESESDWGFAGLADLLRPLAGLIESLPEPQAAALAGALGLGPAIPGDPFSVSVATLSLLSAAARDGSVLLLVDDAHWLDSPSQQALAFVARRLDAEGVAMMVALRDDPPSSYFELAKLPTIRLRALAGTEAQALLEQSAD
ncbi:MAG: AAA family ATPase, partial [Actinobacteria bacterium]|nr:AAA family ATPase [Actinomycetota bacterium]